MNKPKIIGYSRVSTVEQDPAKNEAAILKFANDKGFPGKVRIPAIPDTYSWFNRTLSPDLNGHLVLRKADSSFISLFRINICSNLIVFICFSH